MRTMKTMAAIFVLGLTAMLGVSAASAQGYPGGATLTLSSPTVPQGGVLTATVAGCPAGSEVHFVLNSDPLDMGTVTATSAGDATVTITIPMNFPTGAHTVTATCGDQVLTANVTVLAQAATVTTVASGPLPTTGSNTDGMVRGALALISVGALLTVLAVAFSRKRTNADARV